MRPSQIIEGIKKTIRSRIPTMIWGSPGIGKSDCVRAAAMELERNLIDVRLAQLDPVDLRGLPYVEDGYANYAIPGWLPNAKKHGKNGILFLDEISSALPSIQAAGYQLVLDRKLGDYELPDGWDIVAAGNRTTDRAVAHRMSSALSDRFAHMELDVHLDDWAKWAIAADINAEILSFIRFRPGLLNDFQPDQRSFPTPRSWEFVNRLLPQLTRVDELSMLSGVVGEGAAGEYIAFRRVWQELPNIDELLKAPKTYAVPEEPVVLYAISGALAARAEEKNFANMVEYAFRMPAEYQVILVRDSIARVPEIANTESFNEWAAKNSDVI